MSQIIWPKVEPTKGGTGGGGQWWIRWGVIVAVQSLGRVWFFATIWTEVCQASLPFTISQCFLKLMSIESVIPSNHLICHSLLLLPAIFLSIKVFSNESIFAKVLGALASASVHPKNIRGWFPLRLTGLIFLLSKGLSRVFSKSTAQKHQFFSAQPSLWSNSYIHIWLLEKP